jgi:glycosyltransferase involved in cell wall biosynthesis
MKIIHIISGLGPGGAQVVLTRILENDTHNQHLVISMMDLGIYGEQIKNLNIPIYTLNFPKGKIRLHGMVKLYKILKKQKPDIVQTWMYHADLVGGLISKLAGIKKIYWNLRNSTFTVKTQSLNTMIIAKLCAFLSGIIPKKIIINSYEGRNFHYQLGYKKNMKVINNGYPKKIITKKTQDKNKFIFGMLARWDPQKDYNNFLEAIHYLINLREFQDLQKKIKIKFFLAGHKIDEKNIRIKQLINKLNIKDYVYLMGDFKKDEVEKFYNLIDVHVLSSRSEGFPNVVAESMRLGIPNITTKAGDAEQIVGDTGWVVETRNRLELGNAFLQAIKLYINDDKAWNALKIKANDRINTFFNIEKMLEEFNYTWGAQKLNKKLKKVFHIISGLGSGGAQAVLARLTGYDKNYSHTIISFIDFGIYKKYFEDKKIKLFKLNMTQGKFSLFGFIRLYSILRKEKPDIIQTWMYHADFVGGIIGRFIGVKKIFWNIRNSNLTKEWASFSTIILSKICAYFSKWIPSKIVSCSLKSKNIHVSIGYDENKIKVINNGYDFDKMKFIDKSKNKTFKIGMLARWDPQKDYVNLAKSLIEYSKITNTNWEIYLAGDKIDSNNKKLKDIFGNEIFNGKVYLEGMIYDINSYFAKIDVHVLSSAGNEGFPNVIAEAMSYGIPCISTDVGDASLIVDKFGWVVPVKSPKLLAEKLAIASEECIYRNLDWEKRRLGSRRHVTGRYPLNKMVESYRTVWES